MIIERLETFRCHLPSRRELRTGARTSTGEERLILALVTDDGSEGWGEATAIPVWGGLHGRYFGETVSTVEHIVHDLLAPVLFNADLMSLDPLMDRFDSVIRGHVYAKGALEIALQDLRGKALGVPISTLLGGRYRDNVRIAHMIAFMANEEALAEAERAVEADGITAFQIKGGIDPNRDERLVAMLRDRLGPSVFLRLDANQGYGDNPKTAAGIVMRLEHAGLDAIEQPGASNLALKACRDAVGIPVIADESCWQDHDVLELGRSGACDAISVYIAKAGGIGRAKRVAQLAERFGLPCDLNGSLESGIGTAASIQTALAVKSATLPSVTSIPSLRENPLTEIAGRYWQDDLVVEGLSYEAGHLSLGTSPGLGVVVDRARLEGMTPSAPRVSARARASGRIITG
ncbi:MAG: muconate cycloisomerase [Mesorhizobium sp.]|uniref:mandelate racemase/muconate lactonizing enzyme family protein n=1 Tax=Mesorhizobium sp. TaxID=1871066 RepID=UPI000FEA6BBF|nr:enolase C-terminal domain-like protein [Mesorhizobium sp.]RWA98510.1 MAG: muconate cycloisomerase [Mesorhizobium sp.]RWB09531.1 MAG: muconate cycloisomerase [Mesorhizobium sp.]